MKKIKILIIIFIILIIFLTLTLLIIKQNNKIVETDNNEEEYINQENYNLSEEEKKAFEMQNEVPNVPKTQLKKISSEENYFKIKSIIDSYFYECKNLQLNDSDIVLPRTGLNDINVKSYIEEQKKELEELAQNALFKILGDKYIKEFGITQTNINNKLGINYSYKYVIDNILVSKENDEVYTYIVNGILINSKVSSYNNFKLIVVIDTLNTAYHIYPQEYLIKHNYNNLKEGDKLNLGVQKIENNIFNKYQTQKYTDELMCNEYFSNLKNKIIYAPNSLYNALDSEYAKKRFENIEKFRSYINENKDFFLSLKFIGYKIVEIGTQKEYICIDQYNNYYIFKRTGGLLDYSILLDDYTIMEGSEIITYSKLDESSKAQYNLMKFIKMINHKDYNAIYNILNSEFRNSNFKSVNDLKTYIKNNFYDINEVKFEKMEEKENYYIFKCKISNYNNSKENKNINIIIGKTNNTNFEMSFSFE